MGWEWDAEAHGGPAARCGPVGAGSRSPRAARPGSPLAIEGCLLAQSAPPTMPMRKAHTIPGQDTNQRQTRNAENRHRHCKGGPYKYCIAHFSSDEARVLVQCVCTMSSYGVRTGCFTEVLLR